MNVFIFAIGGTGARVLRSFTYCLASGMACVPNDTTIIPMIIDYDRNNGDKTRTIKLLETYSSIRNYALDGVTLKGDERFFFKPEVKYLSDVNLLANKQNVDLQRTFEFQFGVTTASSVGTFANNIDFKNFTNSNR
mgnify:CR=1 FL=1